MKPAEYIKRAWAVAVYPDRGTGTSQARAYAQAGLLEEIGEYNGKVKRAWREHHGRITPELHRAMLLELGDVLWYAVALDTERDGFLRVGLCSKGWPPVDAPESKLSEWEVAASDGRSLWSVALHPELLVACIAAIASQLGSSIEEVARLNIEKLESRKARHVLKGEGDSR